MGRIEDALAKLQAQRASDATALPPSVGGVRVAVSAVAHKYGGKLIDLHLDALRALGLLPPDKQERWLANEYRGIKPPLLRNANTSRHPLVPRGNVLMIASPLSGEGKTFTALNLCLSIAREHDWSVVLVDGDCNKPHLTRSFGALGEPGLMDLLRDSDRTFDSLVMPTSLDGFALLPAGARDENAAELFASSRMAAVCDQISRGDPRRMIVFDSPPLLLTSESQMLAAQVGQILVVVRANTTPQRAVLSACERLDASKPINLLLNQTTNRDGGYTYGEHYT